MILCDIGNSSYHFLINGMDKKIFFDENLPAFNEDIYYVSVNAKALENLKKYSKKLINVEKFLNFETSYKGMGLDRKLACLNVKDAIIIDAGSAITVDIVKNSEHKGGFILPGLRAINNLYEDISSVLKHDLNLKVNLDKIPLNTQDAISYWTLKSIILPIQEICLNNQIIITGGDGKVLSAFFDNCIYKEHLIFDNIKGLINANNRITKR